MADDEGGGGFVGRVEQDRAQIMIALLKPPQDRIALAHLRPARARTVQRKGRQRLLPGPRGVLPGPVDLPGDLPAGLLPHQHGSRPLPTFDRKGDRQRGGVGRERGPAAEVFICQGEGEGTIRRQRKVRRFGGGGPGWGVRQGGVRRGGHGVCSFRGPGNV